MSQPVTVALRAYVAVETAISVATMMLPKNSPNSRTDNGVASTTAPARRWVAWEIASRRNSSLIPRFPHAIICRCGTIGQHRCSGCDRNHNFSDSGGRAAAARGCAHRQVCALHCDGHHEMSDSGAGSERPHNDAESAEPPWPHRRLDGPFAGRWRKSMRRSSDELRELRDDEVDGVSG